MYFADVCDVYVISVLCVRVLEFVVLFCFLVHPLQIRDPLLWPTTMVAEYLDLPQTGYKQNTSLPVFGLNWVATRSLRQEDMDSV